MPHSTVEKRAIYQARYYATHQDQIKRKSKNYSRQNREKIRAYQRAYSRENRPRIRERFRQWYQQNKDQQHQYQKTYRAKNLQKLLRQQAEYRARNKDKIREQSFGYKLKYLYGITVDQFQQMWEAQAGSCAICEVLFRERKSAHVDHDNESGQIRGLLCVNCNMGIGSLKHDPVRLLKAITYLGR